MAELRKILVVAHSTGLGGIEKSMLGFLTYLIQRNDFHIDLLIWNRQGPLYRYIPDSINIITPNFAPKGIRNIRTPIDSLRYAAYRALTLFGLETKVFKRMHATYDIAIAFSQTGYVPYFVIDKVNARKKIFFFHHGSYDKVGLAKRRDRIYYSRFDAIATMSVANVNMLAIAFPEIRTRLCAVGNIVDTSQLKANINKPYPNEMSSKDINILTIARLSPEKGLTLAFEAARILKSNGFQFKWFFIGGGNYYEEYSRIIHNTGLEDICILLGELENPYEYLIHTDIYVQPSLIESYSLTLREATYYNIPIIATSIPAIKEAISEIKGLILTEPDSTSISKEVERLIKDSYGLKHNVYNTSFHRYVNFEAKKALDALFSPNT